MLLPSLFRVTHTVAVLLILWLKRDAPNQSLKRKKSRSVQLSKLTGRRQTEGETTLKNPEQI
jgi:hypothetical protein